MGEEGDYSDDYFYGEYFYNGSGFYNNTTYTYEHTGDPFIEAREVSNLVFLYVGFPILILGSLANLVAFAVLQTRAFNKSSSGFLLSALALVDTGVLCTGLLHETILAATADQTNVRNTSAAACKLHGFFTYLLQQLSSWTLVLMTLERLLSVVVPIRAKDICTRTRVTFAWGFLTLVLFCVNAHIFATLRLIVMPIIGEHGASTRMACSPFWLPVWPWIDSVVTCFVPGLAILVTNVVIIERLARARRQRRQSLHAQHSNRDVRTKSVTAMLISISVLFFLTTAPATIYFIGHQYWSNVDIYQRLMIYTAVNILLYCNYALNFVMYCISGAKFRKALVDMFCCRNTRDRRRGGSTSQYSVNTTTSSIRNASHLRNASVTSLRSAKYNRSVSNNSAVKFT